MKNRISLDEARNLRQQIRLEQEEIIFSGEDGPDGDFAPEDAALLRELSAELKGIEAQHLEEFKNEETVNLLQPVFGVIADYHQLLYTVFESPHKDPAPLLKKFQATLQRDLSLQMDNLRLDLLPFLERHGIPFSDFVNAAQTGDYYKETTAKILMISGTDRKIDAMLDRITSVISSFESILTKAFLTLHDKNKSGSGDVISQLMTEMTGSLEKFLAIANEDLIPYCDDNGFDPFQILVDLFEQINVKQEESGFEGDLLDEGMMVDIDSLDEDFDDFDDEDFDNKRNRFDEDISFDDEADLDDDDDDFNPGKKRQGW